MNQLALGRVIWMPSRSTFMHTAVWSHRCDRTETRRLTFQREAVAGCRRM
jgi:hypothetical protein